MLVDFIKLSFSFQMNHIADALSNDVNCNFYFPQTIHCTHLIDENESESMKTMRWSARIIIEKGSIRPFHRLQFDGVFNRFHHHEINMIIRFIVCFNIDCTYIICCGLLSWRS